MKHPLELDARETATVLAALRYWQRHSEQGNTDDEFAPIATDDGQITPLNGGEIDTLCEKINDCT